MHSISVALFISLWAFLSVSSLPFGLDNSDADSRKIWVLLAAGSNNFGNYRHQADVAHAYHVVRNHGIPADNIITMMYDDIANNKDNPFPGKLFNSPKAKDVYEGVKIDYKGDDVTPKNFLAILSGNKKNVSGGNGRVIMSTKNDKIFVYFTDHGATGIIAFPNSELTAKELNSTFHNMHKQHRYAEMTFYLEACESGSMFEKILPNNLNIYAITAANSSQSSWGCYCDLKIKGKKMPCLGDHFSVNWMEDSDKSNLNTETLKEQYERVKNLTDESEVCHFGTQKIWNEHVSEFQGTKKAESNVEETIDDTYATWPSREIPLLGLMAKRDSEADPSAKAHLDEQINILNEKRRYLDSQISAIVKKLVPDENAQKRVLETQPTRLHEYLDCHHDAVKAFSKRCFNFGKNAYALKYVYVLANLCEVGIETETIVRALADHCKSLAANVGDIV